MLNESLANKTFTMLPNKEDQVVLVPLKNIMSRYMQTSIIILTILPIVLNALGFDFSISNNKPEFAKFFLTILTSATCCISISIAILISIRYHLIKTIVAPVSCLTAITDGISNIFYMLLINGIVVPASASMTNIIIFAWTISRVFSCVLIGLSHVIAIISKKYHFVMSNKENEKFVFLIILIYSVMIYKLIDYCIISTNIPSLFSPNELIKNPYGMSVMLMRLLYALTIFPMLYLTYPCYLTRFQILSMVPGVIAATYLTVGDCELFSSNFNAAFLTESLVGFSMLIGFILDYISLYKQQEELIKSSSITKEQTIKLQQLAKDTNRAKGDFFSMVSHEIRTPLNGVLTMTQLIRDTSLSDEQLTIVDVIQQSGKMLLTVVSNILDLSKIDANKFNLNLGPLNLQCLCKDIYNELCAEAGRKNLKIIVNYSKHSAEMLIGDKTRLQQILITLVNNAIRHTKHGFVYLNIIELEYTNEHLHFRIDVRDTGNGISIRDQQELFTQFSQLSTRAKERHTGIGLGLIVCKRIIETMGGTIGVNSKLNEGSTFWIELTLPLH